MYWFTWNNGLCMCDDVLYTIDTRVIPMVTIWISLEFACYVTYRRYCSRFDLLEHRRIDIVRSERLPVIIKRNLFNGEFYAIRKKVRIIV
ncbi:hypothetical protein V1478_007314 [Vespula squamosa]|uniref:Uncharacterized protein n=1 Tax=Vespula squamosa TaxID=30214 RepID=A0ABD2B2Y7_VESSQ